MGIQGYRMSKKVPVKDPVSLPMATKPGPRLSPAHTAPSRWSQPPDMILPPPPLVPQALVGHDHHPHALAPYA